MLSKICQTQKTQYCRILLIWQSREGQTIVTERSGVARGPDSSEEFLAKGPGELFKFTNCSEFYCSVNYISILNYQVSYVTVTFVFINYTYIKLILKNSIENIFIFIQIFKSLYLGLPLWLSSKEPTCQCRRHGFDFWVGKIPGRRKWKPTPVFLPGKSHGQRHIVGYIPRPHRRVRYNLVSKQQRKKKYSKKSEGKLLKMHK